MKRCLLVAGLVLALASVTICTRTVNGNHVYLESPEEITKNLERVERTTVAVRGRTLDVTECITRKADTVKWLPGEQNVDVKTTIDEFKLENVLREVPHDEFERINLSKAKLLILDGKQNLDEIVELKYDQKVIDEYKKLRDWSCSYDNGYEFSSAHDYVKITSDGELEVDYSFINEIVKEITEQYDQYNTEMKVRLHGGKKTTVKSSYTTWNTIIDSQGERELLTKRFKQGRVVVNRSPIYKSKHGEQPDTFIEVDKKKQKLWYIVKGKVKMTSDVVTGQKGAHDTPSGVFFVSECIPGKYLVGDGYKTWVNRWMRLTNTGIGLHDATWRTSFGGRIYEYSGSHGCINLPKSFAYKLFSKVSTGTFVVIH